MALVKLRYDMLRLTLGPALCGALIAVSTGCSTPVERRPVASAYVGDAGQSWSVVMPTPEVIELAGGDADAPEFARRDYALGVPDRADALPSDAWPDDTRPSLDRQRRITLSTQAQTFIYFRPHAGPGPSHGHR